MSKEFTMTVVSGNCTMYVLGIDMKCPLCKLVVKSGESHHCTVSSPFNKQPKKKKSSRRAA